MRTAAAVPGFALRALMAIVLLGAGLFMAVSPAAAASSAVLCEGYGGCAAAGHTSHSYAAHFDTSYWNMDAGDECTNYAAYVESVVYKVVQPRYSLGDAVDWAANAAAHGVPVNGVPSVGAVAQWGAYAPGIGPYGHVAIVEAVGPSDRWIDISEQHIYTDVDGYDWTRIYAGSSQWQSWPNRFIHFSTGLTEPLHTAVGVIPNDGDSGYVLDGYGTLRAFGHAPQVTGEAHWAVDIARAVLVTGRGSGYTVDGYGGIHPFGHAPRISKRTYFKGRAIVIAAALCGTEIGGKESGYELDEYGGVHPFGNAPAVTNEAYWRGWNIARGIAVNSTCDGGYTLDAWGGVHPFGKGEAPVANEAYWKGSDLASAIVLYDNSAGYTLDAWGGVHRFSSKGAALPPVLVGGGYTRGVDDYRGLAFDSASRLGVKVEQFEKARSVIAGGRIDSLIVPVTHRHPSASGGVFSRTAVFGVQPQGISETWPLWFPWLPSPPRHSAGGRSRLPRPDMPSPIGGPSSAPGSRGGTAPPPQPVSLFE